MLRLIAILITILLMTSVFQIQKSFSENSYCKYDDVSLNSEYEIINGKLNAICIDKDGLAITVFLIPEGEGILTLTIPRSSLDIRNPDCTDKKFSIEGDKEQIEFNELKETNDSRKFEIHFTPQSVKEIFVMTTDVSVGHAYKIGSECSLQINSEKENIPNAFSPPLKQIKENTNPEDVICNKDLQLIFKTTDSSPACVKPETKIKLIERDWGSTTLLTLPKTWVEIDPIQCLGNPWEQDWLKSHNNDYHSYPHSAYSEGIDDGESIIIKDFYKKQGITVFDVRSGYGDKVIWASCSSSTGYTLYLMVSESSVDKMLNLNYTMSQEEALKHVGEEISWTFKPYEYYQDGKHDNTCGGIGCNNGYRDLKCGTEEYGFGRYGFLIKDNDSVVPTKEREILYRDAMIDYNLCK